MKLVAGREKDRYHLVEALKQAGDEDISEVVKELRDLHESYLEEFERLARSAEEERGEEEW